MLNTLINRFFNTDHCYSADFTIQLTGNPSQSELYSIVISEFRKTYPMPINPKTNLCVSLLEPIVDEQTLPIVLEICHNYHNDLTSLIFTLPEPNGCNLTNKQIETAFCTLARNIAIELNADLPIIHVDGQEVFS